MRTAALAVLSKFVQNGRHMPMHEIPRPLNTPNGAAPAVVDASATCIHDASPLEQ
jgi:hypothetical protein